MNMRRGSGVLCSGAIIYDTFVRPVDESEWGTTTFVESIEYHSGGNGANTSRALAAIGTPVRLIGTVGRDDQGRFVLARLRESGVDVSAVRIIDEPTAATIVMVNREGNRKFFHRLGASAHAFAEPVDFTPQLTAGMGHYHLASLFILPGLRPHAPEMLARAAAAGLTTSLDTNWDPEGLWMGDLAPCLAHLDLLFINEDEARMLTGTTDPAAAAEMVLRAGVRIAVMKLGKRGCAIYADGREFLCPAHDVEVKDTTGAGDCFVAGFLAARLRGAPLEEAGRFANAVAALSVQRLGAVPRLPCYDGVRDWMCSAPRRCQ